jgi:hypothetical protein
MAPAGTPVWKIVKIVVIALFIAITVLAVLTIRAYSDSPAASRAWLSSTKTFAWTI